MSYVGVDACRTGWIAVELHGDREPSAHYVQHIAQLPQLVSGAQVIAIDIPIGLPGAARRRADELAKERLGPRRSSLFYTPPRRVLEAPTHALATEVAVELTGKGISQQSYALRHKILEVDVWFADAPCRVVEVHPETSFVALLGRPAAAPKKSWAGMVERRDALAAEGIRLDRVHGQAATFAAVDDMLDAAAAAWTAKRVHTGEASSLPDPPDLAADGTEMAIWI